MTVLIFVFSKYAYIHLQYKIVKVMKKLVLLGFIITVSLISCRQEDQILSNDDVTNFKIIQESRNLRKNNNHEDIINDTISISSARVSATAGQIVPPPK